MNPYYEQFKQECLEGHGLNTDELGPFYKSVLFQRGYGLTYQDLPICQTYGLGLGETLSNLFYSALPTIKKGLQYLGSKAIKSAANIAEDTIKGRKFTEAAREHLGETAKDIWAKAPRVTDVYKRGESSSPEISIVPTAFKARPRKKRKPGQSTQFGRGLLKAYPLLKKL